MTRSEQLSFDATEQHRVSAIALIPDDAMAALVLGHGAGAGMTHPFMESVAHGLAEHRVATLRYQFPYMEQGRKPPDRPEVLLPTVRNAVSEASRTLDGLPLFAGGKSMGGRMTSMAAAEGLLEPLRGLVFLGFPLHPPQRKGTERSAHLSDVSHPMLFVQGDRDKLFDLELGRPVLSKLGPMASLHVVAGADHGFSVLKRSGRTDDEALHEVVRTAASWMADRR